MPAQKKVQKKTETVENKPKTFSSIVIGVTDRNELQVQGKDKVERVILAHIEVPRFIRKDNKEEMFAYECSEYLRKRLIGKTVKFEIVSETQDGVRTAIPMCGSENICASLLELGYAVLREGKFNQIEELVAATNKAKQEKKGFFNENPEKLCTRKPEDAKMTKKEIDLVINKTMKGFIRKVDSPATYLIETPNRKFVRVQLNDVHPHTPFDKETNKYKFDDIAKEAIVYVEKYFAMRDCEIKITENGQKVRAYIKIGEKDIGEQLLLNGFVTLSLGKESEMKKVYQAAEEKAQNEKKGRYADEATIKAIKEEKEKKEKAASDRIKNAKTVTGFVKYIGKFLKIEQEDGTEVTINFASVRAVYKKDDEKFNKNVEMRMRECIRKQIAGKKVECKLAYSVNIKREEKEFKEDHYDVYANGKNIAIQLLREGIVTLDNKSQNELKQSFDFAQFKQTQTKEFKVIPITEYTATNIVNIKDYFLDTEVFTAAILKVISLTKYLIYVPSKECTLTINIKNCRVPKAGKECQEFVDKARDVITKLISYQDCTVTFEDYFKGILYANVEIKGVGSIQQYLVEKGYVIPTGKAQVSQEVEEMRNNKTNIYAFEVQKEQKVVEEEERKPKKFNDIKFSPEEKVFMTGYDGENVYYYSTKEETAFIDALSEKIKAIKRGKFDLSVGKGYAVEMKGKWYRAEVISMSNGANVVKCIDTGATVIVGKNKMKKVTEEILAEEVKVLSKKLIGIKPLSTKDVYYKTMLEFVAEYYNQEVALAMFNDEAKVIIGDIVLNVHLVAQGLSLIDRRFFDKGEFGNSLRNAENQAKEAHINAWVYGEIFDEDDKERL